MVKVCEIAVFTGFIGSLSEMYLITDKIVCKRHLVLYLERMKNIQESVSRYRRMEQGHLSRKYQWDSGQDSSPTVINRGRRTQPNSRSWEASTEIEDERSWEGMSGRFKVASQETGGWHRWYPVAMERIESDRISVWSTPRTTMCMWVVRVFLWDRSKTEYSVK